MPFLSASFASVGRSTSGYAENGNSAATTIFVRNRVFGLTRLNGHKSCPHEKIPNQSLKIQTNDGSLFVYEITDVAKITKEEPIVINNKPKRHAGYKGFFDVGGGIGIRDFGDNIFSISTSHGYQFSPYFFLGAGIGVEYHTKWEATFMPIFADMRGYFLKSEQKQVIHPTKAKERISIPLSVSVSSYSKNFQ